MSSPPAIAHVDRDRLNTDLQYRCRFNNAFIGFDPDVDGKALNDAASLVGPLVKGVVDGVYDHLFKWDMTKRSFLPPNTGFAGVRPTDLESLTIDDEQIAMRKKFLTVWALKVFTADYNDPKTWAYLDKVGYMHTGVSGESTGFAHRKNKPGLFVDLNLSSLLLAWVEDVLVSTVATLPEDVLPAKDKLVLLRAVNRILWIQNDLFQRHYVRSDAEMAAHRLSLLSPSTPSTSISYTADLFRSLLSPSVPSALIFFLIGLVVAFGWGQLRGGTF